MTTSLVHSAAFPVLTEPAYDAVLTLPLPQLFSRRFAALPPIREVRDQTGEWGAGLGQSRTIVLADGGTMRETLVRIERPDVFTYTIDAITGQLKQLVTQLQGAWSFAPAGTGTRISWTWDVEPARLGAPLMPVFGWMWRGFARQAFEELERQLVP